MPSKGIKLVDGGHHSASLVDRWIARAMKAYLGFVDRAVERSVASKTDECDRKRYPELDALEQNWSVIRTEVDAILKQLETIVYYEHVDKRYARNQGDEKTKTKGEWRIEQFYLYGTPIKRGFARSPKTGEALRKIPGIQTALFSVLQPGAHIKSHRGEYSGALRCHLGLKIPDPKACRLRVEDRTLHWKEGEIFLFDHTHEHEAWNDSDGIRVILIFDFVRKLPFPLSVLNKIGLKLLQKSKHIREAVGTLERGLPEEAEKRGKDLQTA